MLCSVVTILSVLSGFFWCMSPHPSEWHRWYQANRMLDAYIAEAKHSNALNSVWNSWDVRWERASIESDMFVDYDVRRRRKIYTRTLFY